MKMKKFLCAFTLVLTLAFVQMAPIVNAVIPNTTIYKNELEANNLLNDFDLNSINEASRQVQLKVPVKILGITVGSKNVTVKEDKEVYLGGQTVGIALYTKGLFVNDFVSFEGKNATHTPWLDADIKTGDYIISANGIELNDISNLDTILKNSNGNPISLIIDRDGREIETKIVPQPDENGFYRLGIMLRDSAAGLGTVTFVDGENNTFMALGHSISDNGHILKLKSGRVVECNIIGVKKGVKGEAGELKGTFGVNATHLGTIEKNMSCGLVGNLYGTFKKGEKILIGSKEFVREGAAEIYSDFENGTLQKYSIEIVNVNKSSSLNEKNMVIAITDNRLIEKTGGIVQGLSGSPIVQDGRLIGAVTHVMLSDATRGYGVFVENMLETAQSVAQEQLKDAS